MDKRASFKAFFAANHFVFKRHSGLYLGTMFMSALEVLGIFVAMKSTEYMTNSAYYLFQGSTTFGQVAIGVVIFTLSVLLLKVVDIIGRLIEDKLMLKVSYDFEYALNHKLSQIKWEYYENHKTSVEIHKVRGGLDHFKRFVGFGVNSSYFIVGGIVFLSLLAQIHLGAVVIYLGLLLVMNKAFAKVYGQIQNAWDEIQPYKQKQNYFFHLCGDKITHQEFKFNRLFGFVSDRWEGLYQKEYKVRMKIFRKYEITFQTARFLINIPYIAMMIFVSYEIAMGKHEIGFLFLCNQLFNRVLDLVTSIQYSMNDIHSQYRFVESFFNILKLDEEEEGDRRQEESLESPKEMTFREVEYAYPQARVKSLKGVNLAIKKGEKIAIVGHNGSGKTTFTNILLSLTDTFEGIIHLDGAEDKISRLKGVTSCILQDFAQYQMSIRENIEMGYEGYIFRDEEIWSLLEKVGLKEMVEQLPEGINTMLGQLQEGVDLSKGQWQRIAVARLLANPHKKIWILDEPTAYLDPISEIEIYNLIYALAEDRVVLFISHRLGFAKRADRIVVFHDGKVQEEGSHKVLLERNGIYAKMYKAQEQWYVA